MQKGQDPMRCVSFCAVCMGAAAVLFWRAETYVDVQGRTLLLARLMCILLAVMIGIVGLMRGLEALDSRDTP